MASRKNKTLMYVGFAALAWWFYQKSKGNNFLGQPLIAAAPANPAATPAAIAAQVASS